VVRIGMAANSRAGPNPEISWQARSWARREWCAEGWRPALVQGRTLRCRGRRRLRQRSGAQREWCGERWRPALVQSLTLRFRGGRRRGQRSGAPRERCAEGWWPALLQGPTLRCRGRRRVQQRSGAQREWCAGGRWPPLLQGVILISLAFSQAKQVRPDSLAEEWDLMFFLARPESLAEGLPECLPGALRERPGAHGVAGHGAASAAAVTCRAKRKRRSWQVWRAK
jgi:hypothetical protein